MTIVTSTSGARVTMTWSVASTVTIAGLPFSFDHTEWSLGSDLSYYSAGAWQTTQHIGYNTAWTGVVTAVYKRTGHGDHRVTQTVTGTTGNPPPRLPGYHWIFQDEDGDLDDWSFPVNPNEMTAPEIVETINAEPISIDMTGRDVPSPTYTANWTWNGTLYTLDDVDMMQFWLDHGRPIWVVDHFRQTWRIQLSSVDAVRSPFAHFPERHKYTANALMLGRVIDP